MRTDKVVVVPYDPAWPLEFQKLAQEIAAALGELALRIEHVGSTAVPGLYAKPILDIDAVVKDEAALPEAIERLAAIGYRHEGDLGVGGRAAFAYEPGEKPQRMLHHLYVCTADGAELARHIALRDFLISHPYWADAYGRIKREGAALYPRDIDAYLDYKTPVIRKMYSLAGVSKEKT